MLFAQDSDSEVQEEMATAAAPSTLVSSERTTNGGKLSRLLIDGGTTVLRNVFDTYHPPLHLSAGLSANYSILSNLLKKKVLRVAQWDLLYPPGGVIPDSKTFDITLLFLLLTNICGLSPPPFGWHAKPSSGDTSLEANLVRVKLFRNELYGHLSTTSIDTPTFSSLWKDISVVLVALGLNQGEIDRLKAENCGEEEYLDLLLEWCESEEEIKSRLNDIHHSQTGVQQSIEDIRQTQLKGHQILEDSNFKLHDIHNFQREEHKRMEEQRQCLKELLQTSIKDHRAVAESKIKLDEISQSQTKSEQCVKEVGKKQLENLKLLEDSNFRLREVHQTQIDTQEVMYKLHQIHQEDYKAVEETKSKLEKVLRNQEKHLADLKHIEHGEKNTTEEGKKHKEDEILTKIAKIDSEEEVKYHTERYLEGTRVSIFTKVENWLDDRSSQNRVTVISGNAGMGKSVISAVLCKKLQETGRLSCSHFCQHDKARHRNPKVMLQSLASQLSESLPEYQKALVNALSRNLGIELKNVEVKELFELLFQVPLRSLKAPDKNILMVIDGLDESEYRGRNELLELISEHFINLPCWIRFLVTTRPEINISDSLKKFQPLELKPDDEESLKDIRLLFEKKLGCLIQQGYQEIVISELVQKSEGLILYAYLLAEFVSQNVRLLTPDSMDSTLPSGISSVYQTYFQRLENELSKELNVKEEQFLTFLSALVSAREPLPVPFVTEMILSGKNSLADGRKVRKAITCISSLLPVRDDRIYFFHKSVKDWLTDMASYGQHDFTVEEREGHRILSNLCAKQLDDVKHKDVHSEAFNSTTKYALQHGVKHMLEVGNCFDKRLLEEVVNKYVIDLQLVYLKLCADSTAASEDIDFVQKQSGFNELNVNVQNALSTLLFLLRKFIADITQLPHVIFQTVLNEGGPELSSEALILLTSKYSKIPCIVSKHRDTQMTTLKAQFEMSSAVACFDVSPHRDYMVCECKDGTFQFWSLNTGKLLWNRAVIVTKRFRPNFKRAYRMVPCSQVLSIYRSVVFHPFQEVVLPGVLSQAYSYRGDLMALFPKSQCEFKVCSVSADKTAILTDCPRNSKCIALWSLESGLEISRTTRKEDVLSFAWSRDGRILAISYSSGSVDLVDVRESFKTLTQTKLPEVCGMMRFTPDHRHLICLHESTADLISSKQYVLDVNVKKMSQTFSTNLSLVESPTNLSKGYDSPSESGFLHGDPLPWILHSTVPSTEFVLDKNTLLGEYEVSTDIVMQNTNNSNDAAGISSTQVSGVVFSLDGETLYVVNEAAVPWVKAWDVKNGELRAKKRLPKNAEQTWLVPVRDGVILAINEDSPELWNFQLSKCTRRWPDLHQIADIIPVSGERVLCAKDTFELNIINTVSGEIEATMFTHGKHCIACNDKCHVITSDDRTVQLSNDKTVFWEKDMSILCGLFSPDESLVILQRQWFGEDLMIVNAVSGITLFCITCMPIPFGFQFISDEEIIVSSFVKNAKCLRLFNVKSGDLLSVLPVEGEWSCLAACRKERLIAVGLHDSSTSFRAFQVKLPCDKDGSENSR